MKRTIIVSVFFALAFVFASCSSAPVNEESQAPGKTSYKWTTGGPLISPKPDSTHPLVSAKDPSVLFYNGKWYVFYTTCDTKGVWSMAFISFKDWKDADKAVPYDKDSNPNLKGYHCAPNVFYFTPQKKWYMVFQSGQPQYCTTDNIDDPSSWSAPKDFFKTAPAGLEQGQWGPEWLDFFVIADKEYAYLFFTGDNGHVYYSRTKLADFPNGMGEPKVVLEDGNKGALYEGGMTYKLKGRDKYIMMIEAIAATGERYYRSFRADRLDGEWKEDAATWENPFAGMKNVTFEDGVKPWTTDISHGEMIRDGYDETMTIDPEDMQLLFQGMDPAAANVAYHMRPYRIGLLKAVKQ